MSSWVVIWTSTESFYFHRSARYSVRDKDYFLTLNPQITEITQNPLTAENAERAEPTGRLTPKTRSWIGWIRWIGSRSCHYPQTSVNFEAVNIERLKRITVEEGKCGGRPCIRGFRIRVSDILELLAAGASFEEIVSDYPFLESEDILAAIEYAARLADHAVLQAS